jgi:hypothetical protein
LLGLRARTWSGYFFTSSAEQRKSREGANDADAEKAFFCDGGFIHNEGFLAGGDRRLSDRSPKRLPIITLFVEKRNRDWEQVGRSMLIEKPSPSDFGTSRIKSEGRRSRRP